MTLGVVAPPSERFGAEGWVRSPLLALLDLTVAVHTDDAALAALVGALYAAAAADLDRARHVVDVGRALGHEGPGYFVAVDGAVIVRTPAPTVAFSHLVFQLNQLAIEATPGLRLHAGAVDWSGATIVLPGAMGAGKSTLVAGLVRRGAEYVTDEVVALDAAGRVRPYPKPISLGTAPPALGPVEWTPPGAGAAVFLGASGVVPPTVLGRVSAGSADPPATVVLPTYTRGAPTSVTELDHTDAVVEVAAHTFHLELPGTLAALERMLVGVRCFRLESGDLAESCAAVLDLVRPAR